MISSETPDKLRAIIQDTWPNLYYLKRDDWKPGTSESVMNHRKHKQAENQKKKKMYTPDGYIADPPEAECPYCRKKQRACSYINSLSRAWARDACKKKH